MSQTPPPVKHLWRNFWMLLKPFWASKEGKTKGLLVFLLILGLTAVSVFLEKKLNEWRNHFYNALQNYNLAEFQHQIGVFCWLAGALILLAVYKFYFNQLLQVIWRQWMTNNKMQNWLKNNNFYRLHYNKNNTDNPDQRISQDISEFITYSLSLFLSYLKEIAMLFTFISVLWSLSKPTVLEMGAIKFSLSQGYMVWAAIIYAVMGTAITFLLGRPLVRLNFEQQKYEADFRFSLIRVRENADSIALYGGLKQEETSLIKSFNYVIHNTYELMKRQKILLFFTAGYSQASVIFPFVVCAPLYFTKQFALGDLMQTATAFGIVQGSLSILVDSYTDLARWKSVVDRLATFENGLKDAEQQPRIEHQYADHQLALHGLQVQHPAGHTLMNAANWHLDKGDALLIQGPSGCGKSTLLRTLAGLWPYASGSVSYPEGAQPLFLSQKPYLPLGSLRQVLSYPLEAVDAEKASAALNQVGLSQFIERLEDEDNWSHMLSLGEQQRIAFARILLVKPDVLFLDEATSALDEDNEQRLYELVRSELPQTIMVSVGHRSTLRPFHKKMLVWQADSNWQLN